MVKWLQVKTLASKNSLLEPVRENLLALILDKGCSRNLEDGVEFFQGETFGWGVSKESSADVSVAARMETILTFGDKRPNHDECDNIHSSLEAEKSELGEFFCI